MIKFTHWIEYKPAIFIQIFNIIVSPNTIASLNAKVNFIAYKLFHLLRILIAFIELPNYSFN